MHSVCVHHQIFCQKWPRKNRFPRLEKIPFLQVPKSRGVMSSGSVIEFIANNGHFVKQGVIIFVKECGPQRENVRVKHAKQKNKRSHSRL